MKAGIKRETGVSSEHLPCELCVQGLATARVQAGQQGLPGMEDALREFCCCIYTAIPLTSLPRENPKESRAPSWFWVTETGTT